MDVIFLYKSIDTKTEYFGDVTLLEALAGPCCRAMM